jgi:hypothetical protein
MAEKLATGYLVFSTEAFRVLAGGVEALFA